ncbi:hypothetical protein CFIMG_007337RA00001 [Ceratocystis fimbriata CBS 114723]|uniref:Uncharacterized protein n=1 Tax=Ceratocystis fimbriata CBS 114723 TaxID=1035309 RepID=A0A2C5WX67_9PEZI|nr:hypothetical protein CFIMG_007337RA00001 [Ceratocystis fimbriata CBS 114723]
MDHYARARATGSPASTLSSSPSPSPHPRSASPTVLTNMRRFHSRPSSSSSLSSVSSNTSYKSAPAQPELSLDSDSSSGTYTARPRRSGSLLASPFAPPPHPASSSAPTLANSAMVSDDDSDDEEYIRFPNGAFTDPLPPTDYYYDSQPHHRAAAASASSPSPSPGLSRSCSLSSAGSPGRASRASRLHMWHENSAAEEPEADSAALPLPVQAAGTFSGPGGGKTRDRRYSAGSKFTTRSSEAQKYYYGSGFASSITSASEYLSHYVSTEAKKGSKSPKRVRFSLPA